MGKIGTNIIPFHIFYLAHGIHLCVCDVLYLVKKVTSATQQESENESEDEEFDENLEDINFVDEPIPEPDVVDMYKEIIAEVRKIVKMFKKSPVRNEDSLQNYIKKSSVKNLNWF